MSATYPPPDEWGGSRWRAGVWGRLDAHCPPGIKHCRWCGARRPVEWIHAFGCCVEHMAPVR